MKTKASKTFTFAAAHHLPEYVGKCSNVHGHTYELTVVVEGPITSSSDRIADGAYPLMVLDFHTLTEVVTPIIDKFDHQNLNDHMVIPTTEMFAQMLFFDIREALALTADVKLVEVRLKESPTSEVTVSD